MVVGLLLTACLTTSTAQAAVLTPRGTIQALTATTCDTGESNAFEFYDLCSGTSPAAYRAIALCTQDEAVYGAEGTDNTRSLSYASCEVGGATLSLNANWGILMCSNANGSGTFQGYIDKTGDISGILLNWGNGNITTGGTLLCQFDASGEALFNPNQAP